jgi:pimeloyl-ACP methyl ester carboxylesterase
MAWSKLAMRRLAALAALACLLLPVAGARAAVIEELLQLPTEGEATLPYLRSWDDAQPAVAVAVLFNGGGGAVGLLRRGIPRPGANFLVRSRGLFNEQGIVTAVIDVRSDTVALSDSERMGRRHMADVQALVAELRKRHGTLPVFLVGTSRGTVSAAYAGAALGDAVAGVVLTSSVFNASRGGAGLSAFDFASIRTPLLFVHHVDDACFVTPYAMAQRVAGMYTLVSVQGGEPARSDPCEAFSAHGYLGVEAPTVRAITQWMRGQAPPKTGGAALR